GVTAPARARPEAPPQTMEVGQEAKVILAISDVQERLAIKIRVPEVFEYLTASSALETDGTVLDTYPRYNISESRSDGAADSANDDEDEAAAPTPTPTPTATPTPPPSGTPARGEEPLTYSRRYLVFFIEKDLFVANKTAAL